MILPRRQKAVRDPVDYQREHGANGAAVRRQNSRSILDSFREVSVDFGSDLSDDEAEGERAKKSMGVGELEDISWRCTLRSTHFTS